MTRWFDRTLDAAALLACLLLVFQVVSVTADVLSRYFFDHSFLCVIAFNEWSLLFIAMLGAAWLEREGEHTRDDSLIERLGPRAQLWSLRFGQILGIGICLVLVWYGFKVSGEKYAGDEFDFFKMREIPIFWIYLAIPVGSLLWLIQILRNLRRGPRPRGDGEA